MRELADVTAPRVRYCAPVTSPPALRPAAVLWTDGDLDALLDVMLRDHGFEERSMMVSDGISVPDGFFVQKDRHGLLVWVPPDPKRTGMDPVVLPRAVRIEATERPGGTRLVLHRLTAPATAVALTSAAGLTALACVAAWLVGGAAVWTILGLLATIVWGTLVQQMKIAAARTQLAWEALQPALEDVVAPEPALPEGDPYR